MITPKSIVELYDLHIVPEGNKYIVGRSETEIYVLLPLVGVEIIKAIQQHKRISAIERSLKPCHGRVDVMGFVRKLVDHGFVKAIDKNFLHHRLARKKKLLDAVRPERVQWLFSSPMMVLYAIILVLGLAALLMGPPEVSPYVQGGGIENAQELQERFTSYLPQSTDYFFTQYFIILLPVTFLLSWLFVVLHELGHYLAARSRWLKARFGISHRLNYLVATTTVTNLYSLGRKKRFRVLLAGMGVDVLIIALGFLLLFLSDYLLLHPLPLLVYKLVKFVILIEFLGLLWQFMFFMRTDIYYAFEHLVGMYNLMQKTRQFLKSTWKHTFKPHFSKKEKTVVRWYAGFMVLGMLLVFAILVFYSIPILAELFVTSVGNILRGVAALNFSHFYDKLLFLLFFSINQSLLLYTLIKKHALMRKPWFHWGILFLFIMTNYFVLFFFVLLFLVLFSSAFVVYVLSMGLGLLSGMLLLRIVRKLNSMSKTRIIPELFVFTLAVVYGFVLVSFSKYFMIQLAIPGKNSLILGACYVVGVVVSYVYVFEKIHEKRYGRKVGRLIAKTGP